MPDISDVIQVVAFPIWVPSNTKTRRSISDREGGGKCWTALWGLMMQEQER